MSKKLKVGIVYGGRSPEHNISLLSAYNVVANIDTNRWDPVLLPVDKEGIWYYHGSSAKIDSPTDAATVRLTDLDQKIVLSQNYGQGNILDAQTGKVIESIDVIYPVMHGAFGEDGAIQGLAKMCGLPCVGCGILGSSLGMDKDVTKRLLRDADIGVADFVTLRKGYNEDLTFSEITAKLGEELFLKPANLGSSVGVKFTDNKSDYEKAVKEAFQYDPKVIVEEKITGREIECAVLGNENPKASVIGEILPKTWYTFENKYIDDDGAGLAIPAKLSTEEAAKATKIAIDTYVNLECKGLTRVDMFLKENGDIIVNEVNTLPGFTKISMYPKLWENTGIEYQDLISHLINFALEDFDQQQNLKRQ